MGILASAALAILTLSVFARSQMNGPEGVVARYFMAVLGENRSSAEDLVFGSERDFMGLTTYIYRFFRSGGRYRVYDVVRSGDTARVGVVLVDPVGNEMPFIFATQKSGGRWSIDLARTVNPTRMHLGGI
jgi:hypothetical protein